MSTGPGTPLRVVLTGEGSIVRALDVISFTDAAECASPEVGAESKGGLISMTTARNPLGPRTMVDYRLELSFKGPLRPFVRFIAEDLDQLGRDAMEGLAAACDERFAVDGPV